MVTGIKNSRYEPPEISTGNWEKNSLRLFPNFQGCFLVISRNEELFKIYFWLSSSHKVFKFGTFILEFSTSSPNPAWEVMPPYFFFFLLELHAEMELGEYGP